MKQNDLLQRTFKFGIDTIKFSRNLPNYPEYRLVRYQLLKACTSIGANYEESQAGSSKKDFRNKVRISLREARESNYWLRIVYALEDIESDDLKRLLQESVELKNILGAILKNSGDNDNKDQKNYKYFNRKQILVKFHLKNIRLKNSKKNQYLQFFLNFNLLPFFLYINKYDNT